MNRFALLLLLQVGCTQASESTTAESLSTAVKHERLTLIRDSAAEMGVSNAALIGGIAVSETNLAHCWSEATWACMGPESPSCGGPVIAGAADGPCSAMQGGLGMFQFDAGTYTQTVAAYGDRILTVEGNTSQAVSFVVDRLIQDITGVSDWMTAVDYINSVPLVAGDPKSDQWAHFLACRYNGCCTASATCTSRGNAYRDNAIALYAEMGAEFWRTADRCAAIPADGVIDQRSACYLAGGDPRYWHAEAVGYADSRDWTNSTAAAKAKNFAQWTIAAPPGRYHLEVYAEGGEAKAASYQIIHGGVTDVVVIDQSAAMGFVALGDFDLAGDGNEYVRLGDNTGTSMQKLVFDALRVTSLDQVGPGGDDAGGGSNGGCAVGGGSLGAVALVVLIVLRRRRR